ncbi:MAG: nicotinate phosphoribosyltransferase [Cardiobacteriaceae bacterium]|nr:nicotinate phosphoribosyltransferase [Cardiobacteriaceae bacterium]
MRLSSALLTDFYAFTMAQNFFQQKRSHEIAYFDYYFRRLPDAGGYAIFAGLAQVLQHLEQLKFSEEEIQFLQDKALFSADFLTYLRHFRFTGEVWAMQEGSVVFPNEPLLTIRAPLIECVLIETFLLLTLNHQSLIATKAARIVRAANGRAVYEFGARRAHGASAAYDGTRAAYIGGISGSSNMQSAWLDGVPVLGTMSHAYVQSFDDEYTAFLSYAETYPDKTTLLVDTYDVLRSGVPHAIRLHQEYLAPRGYRLMGIRIDSGDLAYLSQRARKMLDAAGLTDCRIIVSNALDEYIITDLLRQEAAIDGFGVGENLITAKSDPVFGGVYKIVALEQTNPEGKLIQVPKIKVSESVGKTTTPAFKQVWRLYDDHNKALADVVGLHDEVIDETKPYTLIDPEHRWKHKTVENFRAEPRLTLVFQHGKALSQPSLEQIRNHCQREQSALWNEMKRLEYPHRYYVDLSQQLWQLKHDLIMQNRER